MLRYLFVALGVACCVLGLVGVFVPVLPTTPFLLLAAALFVRSSPRLYRRLMGHRLLGPYLQRFLRDRALPLRVKAVSVALVWLSLTYGAVCVVRAEWARGLLLAVAVGVTVHLLRFPTSRGGA